MSFFKKTNKEIHNLSEELKKKLVNINIYPQNCDEKFLFGVLKQNKNGATLAISVEYDTFYCGYRHGGMKEMDLFFYSNCEVDTNLVIALLKLALADDNNIKEEYLKNKEKK